jgi:hypothetical protein
VQARLQRCRCGKGQCLKSKGVACRHTFDPAGETTADLACVYAGSRSTLLSMIQKHSFSADFTVMLAACMSPMLPCACREHAEVQVEHTLCYTSASQAAISTTTVTTPLPTTLQHTAASSTFRYTTHHTLILAVVSSCASSMNRQVVCPSQEHAKAGAAGPPFCDSCLHTVVLHSVADNLACIHAICGQALLLSCSGSTPCKQQPTEAGTAVFTVCAIYCVHTNK